jgi:hypothetical protein
MTKNRVQLRLPYFRSHSLYRDNPRIELAVFAFHGASGDDVPDAEEYQDRVHDAAATVPGALEKTLIVAPQIMNWVHLESFFGAGNVPGDLMYFGGDRFWGDSSANAGAAISVFSVVDKMLEHICDSGHFPNLKRIVILGHSGGGQLVNRFAASSPFQRNGIPIRYIVMNPSSYLYFDGVRVRSGTTDEFCEPSAATVRQCPGYNNYGYGPDNLYDYHRDNDTDAGRMIDRYRSRNVIHLSGALDNDPNGEGLDTECGAMLQGANRLERGTIYFNYLQYAFGPVILDRHRRDIVPNAAHNGRDMITSDIGVNYIFEEFSGVEMASLADYFVIRDTGFSLGAGREQTFPFDVPREIIRSGGSKRPILSYYADPSSDARTLKVVIEINNREISNYSYTGGVGRGHQEVLSHEDLNAGVENAIQFRVESGRGLVNLSDVVLWFQVDV